MYLSSAHLRKRLTLCISSTWPHSQAGLLLWQLLWPSDKKTQAKREEAIKAEVLEVSVKLFALTDAHCATPAAGLLALLGEASDAERDTILSAKPQVLVSLQRALSSSSPSLVAAACALMRVLACAPDSRVRLLKAFRDVNWRPMLSACTMQARTPTIHGFHAQVHAVLSIICCASSN